MDRPTQQAGTDEPNDASPHKEEQRCKHTALDQLAQAWKKETANSRNHITRRSLIFIHAENIRSACKLRKRFPWFEPSGFSMTWHLVFGSSYACPSPS
jgi:hypothetical protein